MFDVGPLLDELSWQPWLWNAIRCRTAPGSPHEGASDIWIRYGDITPALRANDWSLVRGPHDAIWYPAWYALPALELVVNILMAETEGKRLGGIWITRIDPGNGIKRHADHGWHAETFKKFYTSLESEPGSEFVCHVGDDEEALNPKAGETWEFDNLKDHSVRNCSPAYRTTLITCIETDRAFG